MAMGVRFPLINAWRADLFGRRDLAIIFGWATLFSAVGATVAPVMVASLADAVHLLVEPEGPALDALAPDALSEIGYADRSGLNEALDRAGDERFLARSRGFAHEIA